MNNHLRKVRFSRIAFFLVVSCLGPICTAHSKELQVVTDIAPVHSLVSMVVGDTNSAIQLIPSSQSPHTYTLKPSQRRALENAGLVIMLSDNFTPSLGRYITSTDNKNEVLILADNIEVHSHDHDEEHGEEHDEEQTSHETEQPDQANGSAKLVRYNTMDDPHQWLDPENAIGWLDQIAEAAAIADSSQADLFRQNAKMAKQQLIDMQVELKEQLFHVQSAPYIVYHDAYNHFAKSYSLQNPIAITLSDARAPSAAKLKRIRAQAAQVNCVFSETQHSDALVNMVTDQLETNRATIDPIGSAFKSGPTLYQNLMRSLASTFSQCLSE